MNRFACYLRSLVKPADSGAAWASVKEQVLLRKLRITHRLRSSPIMEKLRITHRLRSSPIKIPQPTRTRSSLPGPKLGVEHKILNELDTLPFDDIVRCIAFIPLPHKARLQKILTGGGGKVGRGVSMRACTARPYPPPPSPQHHTHSPNDSPSVPSCVSHCPPELAYHSISPSQRTGYLFLRLSHYAT